MDLVKTTISAPTWVHLDTLRLGKWGEYFAKMAFVRAGLDVYSPEVDDRAIDALIRIPSDPPRYLEVQVKTVRAAKPGYIFMRKRHFSIRSDTFLALVHLAEGAEADLYLIPSLVWRSPSPPFADRDYEGKKSEPEFGLTISPAALQKLQPYLFSNVVRELVAGTWPIQP
jgi:hypothetical protein